MSEQTPDLNPDDTVEGVDPEDARTVDPNTDTDVDHEPADPGDVEPDTDTDEVDDGDEEDGEGVPA